MLCRCCCLFVRTVFIILLYRPIGRTRDSLDKPRDAVEIAALIGCALREYLPAPDVKDCTATLPVLSFRPIIYIHGTHF